MDETRLVEDEFFILDFFLAFFTTNQEFTESISYILQV